MIKVKKTVANRPEILFRSGANKGKDKLKLATKALKKEYNDHKAEFDSGNRKFEFNSKLYAHKKIKTALRKIQADKCCFCEAKVTHVAHGDIEHFRPKGGYKQLKSDSLSVPGYFWLAYEWKNLYFSCQICNQRFKKNLFPLSDPNDRVKPLKNISSEGPQFIDPGRINPQSHITFIQDEAVPINNSALGKKTIDELGLNRDEIREDRLQYFIKLQLIAEFIELDPTSSIAINARNRLDVWMQKTSEYSSMVQALFD